MAEIKQKPSGEKRKAAKRKKRGGGDGGGAAPEDGAEQLRQAADRQVGLNSEKLADLLTKNALAGDLACARVLVGLAERKKPIPEPRAEPRMAERGPSQAEQLAAEPEWQGAPEDEEQEGESRYSRTG